MYTTEREEAYEKTHADLVEFVEYHPYRKYQEVS